MFQRKIQLDDSFLSMSDFARLLHKQPVFSKVLREFVQANMQNETVEIENELGNKETIPVFYYGQKKANRSSWYILDKTVVPFLKRHIKEIEKLGVPLENLIASIGIIPVVQRSEISNKDIMNLWDVATKCSYNTKILKSVTQEIKRLYLSETFTQTDKKTGAQIEKPMFVFVKNKMGQSGVFMLKEALPVFLKRHKEALKNFTNLLESSNEHLSLRSFSRYLGTSKYEPELNLFIQQHINETFETKDKNGCLKSQPIFSYEKQTNNVPVLNINKEGALHFILKYQDELIKMGFKGVHALLHNFEKKGFQKGYLSIREIALKMHKNDTFARNLSQLIHSNFANEKIEEFDPKTKQIKTRNLFFSRYQKKMIYFIKETDLPLFIRKYQHELLKLGVEEKIINHLLQKNVIPVKNDKMVTFRDFMRLIRRNNSSAQEILNEVKSNHLNDTYEEIDTNGNKVQKPIFIYAQNSKGFSYYFTNKKAMFSFFEQQKNMLTKTFGIKKEIIDSILGKQDIQPFNPDYIFITKLLNKLHIHQPDFTNYIKKNHINETYPVLDENGNITQQPMFIFMSAKAIGIGNYAIHKDALIHFAKRHQKLLNIKDEVITALKENQPLVKKEETFLTITQLTKFLNKSTLFTSPFRQKIKAHYLNETATIQINGEEKTIPVFSKAFTKTGAITIYVDTKALPSFLNKHKNNLIKLGFKEENIDNLIHISRQDPLFHVPHLLKEKERNKIRLIQYYASRQRN